MLEELNISGLGVIEQASLPLGPGLTVLTGETGAGKTMLVTALLLLFGGRADVARVRTGAAQATVDGRIGPVTDLAVVNRVRAAGGELDEDATLVLRRQVTSAGRSRAFVGGAPAPIGVLAELAQRLVVVHGQSDQIRLARPAEQRAALDRYAQLDLGPYTAAYHSWREASDRLAERTTRARELRREADLLANGIAEIRAVAPQLGEDTELDVLASRLARTDALRTAARLAHDALLGDPDDPATDRPDVAGLLAAARRAAAHEAGADPALDAFAQRLRELGELVAELGSDLAVYRDQLDADPARLAAVEQRRSVLTGLTRRYGEDLAAVLDWAQHSERRLAELDVSEDALAALAAERDAAQQQAAQQAARLRAQRHDAARRLSVAVSAELAGLAMGGAAIDVEVRPRQTRAGHPELIVGSEPSAASADGTDEVEFLLRAHPQAPAVPLARGASGGELSRVMLALEVCLAGTDPVPTMVFDEIDAGVGGRAAVEVGRRLARLAADHQVIAVTHLAQVASFAVRHLVVDKPSQDSSVTRVREVTGAERERELARMLAGTDSRTALKHAAELLVAGRPAAGADGPLPRPRMPRKST